LAFGPAVYVSKYFSKYPLPTVPGKKEFEKYPLFGDWRAPLDPSGDPSGPLLGPLLWTHQLSIFGLAYWALVVAQHERRLDDVRQCGHLLVTEQANIAFSSEKTRSAAAEFGEKAKTI
jgi:hypothetical protein